MKYANKGIRIGVFSETDWNNVKAMQKAGIKNAVICAIMHISTATVSRAFKEESWKNHEDWKETQKAYTRKPVVGGLTITPIITEEVTETNHIFVPDTNKDIVDALNAIALQLARLVEAWVTPVGKKRNFIERLTQ